MTFWSGSMIIQTIPWTNILVSEQSGRGLLWSEKRGKPFCWKSKIGEMFPLNSSYIRSPVLYSFLLLQRPPPPPPYILSLMPRTNYLQVRFDSADKANQRSKCWCWTKSGLFLFHIKYSAFFFCFFFIRFRWITHEVSLWSTFRAQWVILLTYI